MTIYLSFTYYNPFILLLTFFDSCSGKAKPSKRAKKNKSAKEPTVNEPELQTAAPEASIPEPLEPVHDMPTMSVDLPVDQTTDGSLNPKASSPIKTANPQDVDVEITKTGFTESGRPTILAEHSAMEEHVEPHKV